SHPSPTCPVGSPLAAAAAPPPPPPCPYLALSPSPLLFPPPSRPPQCHQYHHPLAAAPGPAVAQVRRHSSSPAAAGPSCPFPDPGRLASHLQAAPLASDPA
ncbi:hypothetical protein Vretifemale_7571, partial [Volvox reticuliferus]